MSRIKQNITDEGKWGMNHIRRTKLGAAVGVPKLIRSFILEFGEMSRICKGQYVGENISKIVMNKTYGGK